MNDDIKIRTARRPPYNQDTEIWFMFTRIVDGIECEYGDLLPHNCSDKRLLKEIKKAMRATRRTAEEVPAAPGMRGAP